MDYFVWCRLIFITKSFFYTTYESHKLSNKFYYFFILSFLENIWDKIDAGFFKSLM